MPVTSQSKHALLDLFSRMESDLKKTGVYLEGAEGARASANWPKFGSDIGPRVRGRVSHRSVEVLTTLPPMREIVRDEASAYDPRTDPLQGGRNPESLGKRLIEASVRVRNNLIHGGKEDPEMERYPQHDQAVVDAALEVLTAATLLLQQTRR